MRYYLSDKAKIIYQCIKDNNIDIKNSGGQSQGNDSKSNEEMELKACILTSAILSEDIVSDLPKLSNVYLDIEDEIYKDLRQAKDMIELRNVVNRREFRNLICNITLNEVLSSYKEMIENDKKQNLDMFLNKNESVNRNKGFDDNVSKRDNMINNYHPNFTETVENKQYNNTFNPYANRENTYNTNTENQQYNINNSYNTEYNYNMLNNTYDNRGTYREYNGQQGYYDNLKDDNNVYDYGLNHDINGVKTISSRLPDGRFSFEMVIPVGYTGKTQAVNKKILTKEEHAQFINKYRDEIFDLDREKTLERQNTLNREYDYPDKELELKF